MTKRIPDKGFTLLEVMIALAVIGTLLVTLIYTLNYHISVASRHETATVAVTLGTDKISELSLAPHAEHGAFPAPYEDYSYEAAVSDSAYPGITELAVTVRRGDEKFTLRELLNGKPLKGGEDEPK